MDPEVEWSQAWGATTKQMSTPPSTQSSEAGEWTIFKDAEKPFPNNTRDKKNACRRGRRIRSTAQILRPLIDDNARDESGSSVDQDSPSRGPFGTSRLAPGFPNCHPIPSASTCPSCGSPARQSTRLGFQSEPIGLDGATAGILNRFKSVTCGPTWELGAMHVTAVPMRPFLHPAANRPATIRRQGADVYRQNRDGTSWRHAAGPSARNNFLPRRVPPKAEAFFTNKLSWQRHTEPDAIFQLPVPWRVARAWYKPAWKAIQDVGLKTGAFVETPSFRGDSATLSLYGHPNQVAAAIKELAAKYPTPSEPLVANKDTGARSRKPSPIVTMPPRHSPHKPQVEPQKKNWAKLHSTINPIREAEERVVAREQEREAFRRAAYDDTCADYTSVFLWPTADVTIEQAFGNTDRLEKLNPVRDQYRCYIAYNAERQVIRVAPDVTVHFDIESQKTAMKGAAIAIRNLIAKVAFDMEAAIQLDRQLFLLQLPSFSLTGFKFKLENKGVDPNKPEYQVPILVGPYAAASSSATGELGAQAGDCNLENELRLRSAVKKALPALQLTTGRITMRATLGSFRLRGYRTPDGGFSGSLEDFSEILQDSNTIGELLPVLNDNSPNGTLQTRCQTAEKILVPFDHDVMELKDSRLQYGAKFVFPGNMGYSVVHEVAFVKAPYSEKFEQRLKVWYKKPDAEGACDMSTALDVTLVDFEKCPWNLKITAFEHLDYTQITKHMAAFANSIRCEAKGKDSILDNTPKIYHEYRALESVVETVSIRYRLAQDPNYVFELSRQFRYTGLAATNPAAWHATFTKKLGTTSQPQATIPQSRWAASLYHMAWDETFGLNARLKQGQKARWEPYLLTFFPPPTGSDPRHIFLENDTFHNFVQIVSNVSEHLGLSSENVIKAEFGRPSKAQPQLAMHPKPHPEFSLLD